MTRQELFDKVCVHLKQQRRRALDPRGFCRLRTADGLKCAVGCLLTDEQLDRMGESMSSAFELFPLRQHKLLGDLVDAHDYAFEDKFKARLKAVAKKRKLRWKHG